MLPVVLVATAAELAIAELDGDGRKDLLVVTDFPGDLVMYRGRAGGLDFGGRWPALHRRYRERPAVSVADLDGDLRPDPFLVDNRSAVFLPAMCLAP